MRTQLLFLALVAASPEISLADPPNASGADQRMPPGLGLQVTSPAFRANEAIPPEYTCDGTSATPPLAWSTVPNGTKSIAILVEDVDAPRGTFTHWLVTGISPARTGLRSGGGLPYGAIAAKNSNGELGYSGLCPDNGRHRYEFYVFALDTSLGEAGSRGVGTPTALPAGRGSSPVGSLARPASKLEFLNAIEGHVLADGKLTGTYQRTTTP